MTKTFAQAPKPKPQLTAEAIAAFERAGPGQDTHRTSPKKAGAGEASPETPIPTNVEKKEPTEPQNQEPVARLSIDLPKSLHRRFKTACARADLKMVAEAVALIERRTVELEQG